VDAALIIGDTYRCPELRHEVPLGVPDPFVYLERDGRRHAFVHSLEAQRIDELGLGLEVHLSEEIVDPLIKEGLSVEEVSLESTLRFCRRVGLERAVVPHTFPAGHLDRLRGGGIELAVDQTWFDRRRRVKNEHELTGIRRAQRAAEAGMRAAAELIGSAEVRDGGLRLDGAPLTVERVKAAVAAAFEEHGCTSEDFIVAPGAQGAVGHEMGSGPIGAGEPVVVDLWPRDRESSCFADMTRTFVAGEPDGELAEWHRLTREALARVTQRVRPRAACGALFDAACEVYEDAGHPTLRTKREGESLRDGFFHGLGHGVGLEVHERPFMGRIADGELVAGDVITIEPGTYRAGYGGVRLEDLVLVTEDGCEVLTDFPYDLEVVRS
jgi:Xaa-Pro aminopeptidase